MIRDPRLFNYVICAMYSMNSIQFLVRGLWTRDATLVWNSAYWLAALSITAVVTWGHLK